MHFDVEKHTIYKVLHGSRAYGTHTSESDWDEKGTAVSPRDYVLGYAYKFEQQEYKRKTADGVQVEGVTYDVRKFINLAADCNPNIIEVLFVEDSDVLHMHPAGELLCANRELFLSKKARHKYSGYAIGQIKRIKTHRNWLLHPPTHKPTREEYGLSIEHKITPDMMGAFNKLEAEGVVAPNVMELVQQEKRYQTALHQWNQFENWKATRNEARAALEAKYGYDTKHGGHVVRLLRMCREILEGKGVHVKRPDAEELLAIRRGAWSYDQLLEWATREDEEMQALYETSTLRHAPDVERLNALCIEVQELFWRSE